MKSIIASALLCLSLLLVAKTGEDKIDEKRIYEIDEVEKLARPKRSLVRHIHKNFSISDSAKTAVKDQHRVMVSFIVEIDGSLSDIEVIHNIHPEIDEEAMRVIRLTTGKWKPARIKHQDVRMRFVKTIRF